MGLPCINRTVVKPMQCLCRALMLLIVCHVLESRSVLQSERDIFDTALCPRPTLAKSFVNSLPLNNGDNVELVRGRHMLGHLSWRDGSMREISTQGCESKGECKHSLNIHEAVLSKPERSDEKQEETYHLVPLATSPLEQHLGLRPPHQTQSPSSIRTKHSHPSPSHSPAAPKPPPTR